MVLFLLLVTVYALFPFFWMVMSAVKTERELRTVPPTFLPREYTLSHYGNVFTRTNIPRYFVNSLVIATGATSLALVIAVVTGYGFARFRFRGRSMLLNAILSSQMIPAAAMMVPLFLTLRALGLVNTYLGLILAYLVFTVPLSVWMMTNYFYSIPESIEEAATIDGATRLQMPPAHRPAGLDAGDHRDGNLQLHHELERVHLRPGLCHGQEDHDPAHRAGGVHLRVSDRLGGPDGGSVLMTLPIVTIFFVLQRYFISGLTAGATKG